MITGMSQRKLAGDGDEPIAHHENDVDEHENQEIQLIRPQDERQDADDRQDDGEPCDVAVRPAKHSRALP